LAVFCHLAPRQNGAYCHGTQWGRCLAFGSHSSKGHLLPL